MKVTRRIAIVAIAALAACSEQSQDEVMGVRQYDHYVGHDLDAVDPDYARFYTDVNSCSQTPQVAAFVVRGSEGYDPTAPGSQFSIIAPERTIHLTHGMLRSYAARHGYDAINQALWNVDNAAMRTYGALGSGLKYITATELKSSNVVAADVNGDGFTDAIVFAPISDLQKVGIIGPERDLILQGRAPAKGGQQFNPKGPVSVGGSAPCTPPPPPPPIHDRF